MNMKSIKTLAAGLLACALGNAAFAVATTHLYFIGSTAFRAAAVQAVEDAMGSGTYKVAYVGSGSTELKVNQSILSGTIGGNPVIVKFNWTGSVTGVQSLVNGTNFTNGFLADSVLTGVSVGNTATALSGGAVVYDPAEPGNVTMSDSHPSSTGLNTSGLTSAEVGVIAFEWVVNNGAPASITNITNNQAQALYTGFADLSQFTGVSSDSTIPVYAVGRSGDSGTRLSYLTETGLGLFASIFQVQATTVSGVVQVDSFGYNPQSPSTTTVSDPFLGTVALGQSGYASGGSAAGALVLNTSAAASSTGLTSGSGAWLFSYLGRSDANTAVAGGARRLTYNGVADFTSATLSNANGNANLNTPIIEGQYQGWEIEHLAYRSSLADGQQVSGQSKELTLVNAIISQIQSDASADSASGLQLSAMHVSRNVEGGVITHN